MRRDALVLQLRCRRECLGDDRAGGGDLDRRYAVALAGVDQAIGAGEDLATHRRIADACTGIVEGSLVEGARGEPEVVTPVLRLADRVGPTGVGNVGECVAQQPVERRGICRLDERRVGQLQTDRGRDRRLVRSTFRRQRHARRGAGDHEASTVVRGIHEGIETTEHEGVVEGPHGQERLVGQIP